MRIVTELVRENPQLVAFLGGGGLTAEAIQEQGAGVVATIIAAGYGLPDDEKALKHAADLPLDVQLDLIAGIVKATLGGGTGPFAAKIRHLTKVSGWGSPEEERGENRNRQAQTLQAAVATAIEFLIARGNHSERRIWELSPRQLFAYFKLAKRRCKIEQAEMMGYMRIAMWADGRDMKKSLRSLLDDAD